MTQGADISAFLKEVKARVDRSLDALVPSTDRPPARIHECMRYSLLDGGKRVRPALMEAVGEALGNPWGGNLMPAMCAVEMIHVSSLILDDLPSMDDAETRHGRKANHVVYGEATAILAAIALLNRAFGVLNDSCDGREGVRRTVIAEAAAMVGTDGIIGGEAADLMAVDGPLDERTLEYIESHKTGSLIVGAARIAGTLSGATPAQLNDLTEYARSVGMAYQLRDDILHLTRTPEQLGKVSHRDESAVNYAQSHGLDASRLRLNELCHSAVASLASFDSRADRLRALARFLGEGTS